MRKFILRSEPVRERAARLIGLLPVDKKKPLEIVIKQHVASRSLEQNALYWKLLSEIAERMSEQTGEYHPPQPAWNNYFKQRFLGEKVMEVDGVISHYVPSSASLKMGEFSEYYTKVEVWAAEQGIIVGTYAP